METQNEIVENNKLIAEFEGHKINFGYNKKGVLFLGQHISEDKLIYHSSWNWLMPVVEKIENFTDEKNGATYNFKQEQSFIEIIENHTSETILELDGYNKMDATYKAVVEFIKWYNKK